MELLRSKSRLTRLQILLNILLEHPGDQRSISTALRITPQAVSDYLRKMEEEGQVDLSGRSPRATVKGVDLLQSSLLQLKDFIDTSISRLSIIRSTDAIASKDLEEGDRVDLFMKDGLLYTGPYTGKGSSGVVDNGSREGEMVSISSLSGVMVMPDPEIVLLEVPSARQGGGKGRLDPSLLRSTLDGMLSGGVPEPRIAVLDLEAAALLKRSGMGYSMELPGHVTIINHLQRGLPVLLIGTPFSISAMMREVSMEGLGDDVLQIDHDEVMISGSDHDPAQGR